jgi:hypothetical protein
MVDDFSRCIMHIYDLSEEFGLPVEDIRKWLKAKGFGSADRLTTAAVSAFKAQHQNRSDAMSFERIMLGQKAQPKATVKSYSQKNWTEKPIVDEEEKPVNPLMIDALQNLVKPGTRIDAMAKGAVIPKAILPKPNQIDSSTSTDQPAKITQPRIHNLVEQGKNRWDQLKYSKDLDDPQSQGQGQYEKLLDQYRLLQEQYEKELKAHQSLLNEHQALQRQVKQLQNGKAVHVDVHLPKSSQAEASNLYEALATQGFDQLSALSAIKQVLSHPIQGPVLLYQLDHFDVQRIFDGLTLACDHSLCQKISCRQKSVDLESVILVPDHLCPICQGSDYRRAYQSLVFGMKQKDGTHQIIVVGGLDDAHHSIKQLSYEHPGIEWIFVAGNDRMDQSRAQQKVQKSEIVVIWPTDHLPHSLSILFKQACQNAEIPFLTLAPGQRSVVQFVEQIMQKLGIIL